VSIKLQKTNYSKCSPKLRARLKKLTLTGENPDGDMGSTMYRTLECLEAGDISAKDVPIVIARNHNTIMGWSLIAEAHYTMGRRIMMIYVPKRFRRRGIGTKLARRMSRFKNVYCYPWDEGAKGFYDNFDIKPYWR